jgi:hypothetical protein
LRRRRFVHRRPGSPSAATFRLALVFGPFGEELIPDDEFPPGDVPFEFRQRLAEREP